MVRRRQVYAAFAASLSLVMTPVLASAEWLQHKTGDDTAFERRWVSTDAIESMSSSDTLADDMYLSATIRETRGIALWVSHVSSELCEFSDWQLAVDKSVVSIKSELAEDTSATRIFPRDDDEAARLLELFRTGERVAVQFHTSCDNMFYLTFIGTSTMIYSLDGISSALDFLSNEAQ